jgi:hypothetical protein
MVRRFALVALVLVLGLALWLWKGRQPAASPIEAPTAPAAQATAESQVLEAAPLERAPAPEREAVAFDPAKDALLVVICRTKGTNEPVADETLFLCDEDARPARIRRGKGTRGKFGDALATGAEGRVEFELNAGVASHLWVSDWRTVDRPNQDGSIAALSAGERRELVVELDVLPGRFYGRVVARETQRPIAGAALRTFWSDPVAAFTTGADGRFDVPRAGLLTRFTVTAEGFGEVEFAALSGHETPEKPLVLELERGATLIGVLIGDSSAREGLQFEVTADSSRLLYVDPQATHEHAGSRGTYRWRAKFDAAGRAMISGLPAGLELGASLLEGSTRVLSVPETFTLAKGERHEVQLDRSAGCELSGRALDDEDKPVAGLRLFLLRGQSPSPDFEFARNDDSQNSAVARTDEDGRFRFPGIAPGTWRIRPDSPRRASGEAVAPDAVAALATPIEIRPRTPAMEITLRVHRGISIRGRLLDADDHPVKATVMAIGPTGVLIESTDAKGSFEFGPLAPGSYRLSTSAETLSDGSSGIEVQAGAQNVVLRIGHKD